MLDLGANLVLIRGTTKPCSGDGSRFLGILLYCGIGSEYIGAILLSVALEDSGAYKWLPSMNQQTKWRASRFLYR